jgi:beta-lactamase regulating signal transducer with metallopeptidase domain
MTSWIAENLAASALLIALVLVVRVPVARLFGPRAALALWLAPVVRTLIPPVRVEAPMPDIFVQTTAVAAQASAPIASAMPIATILLIVWAAGAVIFTAAHLFAYDRFIGHALTTGLRLAATGSGEIDVIATGAVAGPAAAGLVERLIFVPADFTATFSPEEQELALRHELLHHRRGDLWLSALALLMLAIHWFNPLAHFAHRAFRHDLEAACDADLLDATSPMERATYASAILKCAAGTIPKPICALTDTDELKGRLTMMTLKHGFAQRMFGSLLAVSIAAGGLLLALPAIAQTTTTTTKDGKTIVEKRKIILRDANGKERQLSSAEMAKMPKCQGQKFEITSDGQADKNKVERQRFLICAKGKGESKAEFAESLQKAIDRIQSEADMSAATKAEMTAKLQAKIAELREGK